VLELLSLMQVPVGRLCINFALVRLNRAAFRCAVCFAISRLAKREQNLCDSP
jgi:hypothetical protein